MRFKTGETVGREDGATRTSATTKPSAITKFTVAATAAFTVFSASLEHIFNNHDAPCLLEFT